MKKILLLAMTLFLLTGCGEAQMTQEPSITQESNVSIEPSATLAPAATPEEITHEVDKAEIAEAIQSLTNAKGTRIFCEEVTWEDDLLKLTCNLVDWDDEPSLDHHFLHYRVVAETIPLSLQEVDWERHFSDETVIEITTIGNIVEQLSQTSFSTVQKIMDGSITNIVEWLGEAEVVIN